VKLDVPGTLLALRNMLRRLRIEGVWAESCFTNNKNCAFLRTEEGQWDR